MDVAAFLLALVPIIWLVVMLLCFKWPAWKAAIGSFVLSCVLAFAWWHLPVAQIATARQGGFKRKAFAGSEVTLQLAQHQAARLHGSRFWRKRSQPGCNQIGIDEYRAARLIG